MHPTDDLLPALDDAARLLREHGHAHWAQWLDSARDWIANGDLHGVTHLLSAFGGMGSLGDVMLADADANERLRALTGSLYELAAAIQRTADREMR
jgi:predicted sugar kinase